MLKTRKNVDGRFGVTKISSQNRKYVLKVKVQALNSNSVSPHNAFILKLTKQSIGLTD